jgi:hypothetical protein
MAVLFPTPFGHTLRPDKAAQLLQGFLNIQNVEGVETGKLTKSNLDSYAQKRFLAADPSSAVAAYLNTNFADISKLDGDASSISVDDLIKIRRELPAPPPVTDPPPSNPPADNQITLLLFLILQRLFGFLGF